MRNRYLIWLTLIFSFGNNYAQSDSAVNRKFKLYSANYFHIGSTHFPIKLYSTLLNGGYINEKLKGEFNNKNELLRMGGEAQSDICIKIPSMKKVDYCYIGFRQLFTFGGRYHQSLFQFIFDGNQELDFVNLSKSAFHNRNFQLLQFGIIKNNISVGLSIGNVLSENTLTFNSSDFIEFNNNYNWNVHLSPSFSSISNNKNLFKKNGQVFSMDGRIIKHLNPQLDFEMGVQNLGVLHYSNEALFKQIDTNFVFEGFSFEQILNLNETIENVSNTSTIDNSQNTSFKLTPYTVWGITNYVVDSYTYSLSFFYRHDSQFIPRFNFMVSKQIKSKLSLSSNIAYGGFTQFQWGARLLYSYKNHYFGINYMNVTSFLPSWSKSFGVGLNFNIRL